MSKKVTEIPSLHVNSFYASMLSNSSLKWRSLHPCVTEHDSSVTRPYKWMALFFFISFIAYNIYLTHDIVKHFLSK